MGVEFVLTPTRPLRVVLLQNRRFTPLIRWAFKLLKHFRLLFGHVTVKYLNSYFHIFVVLLKILSLPLNFFNDTP